MKNKKEDRKEGYRKAPVLYQKLGERWYIFTEDGEGGDILYAPIPEGVDPTKSKFELLEEYVSCEGKNIQRGDGKREKSKRTRPRPGIGAKAAI